MSYESKQFILKPDLPITTTPFEVADPDGPKHVGNVFVGHYKNKEECDYAIKKLKMLSEIFSNFKYDPDCHWRGIASNPPFEYVVRDEPQEKNIISNICKYSGLIDNFLSSAFIDKLPNASINMFLGLDSISYDEKNDLKMRVLFEDIYAIMFPLDIFKNICSYPPEWTPQQFTEHADNYCKHRRNTVISSAQTRFKWLIELVNNEYIMEKKKKVSIIDFGGELGLAYLTLKIYFKDQIEIDYHIVETEAICEKGNLFYELSEIENIKLHKSAHEIPLEDIDIVISYASLGYADDWKKEIGNLLNFKPKHIIITRTHANAGPSFLTRQIVGMQYSLPFWFWNENEFMECFKNLYDIVDHEEDELSSKNWGFIGYPQNIKTENLRHMKSFIFERKENAIS